MKTSLELHNLITMERDKVAQAVAEERIEDARRSEGRIEAWEEQLSDALKAEDEMRASGVVPVAASEPERKPRRVTPRDVAEMFLGDREEFKKTGIEIGAKKKFGIKDAIVTLDAPETFDPTVPRLTSDRIPMGFLSTLASGTTDGDVKYLQAGAYDNNAGFWNAGSSVASGTVASKAESGMTWTPKTAELAVVAHYIPVLKPTLWHYGQMQSIISTELLYGLRMAQDAAALNATGADGQFTGVLKDSAIQTYTAKDGENVFDHIRRMKTASLLNSGLYPDHVAMHPLVLEEIELAKASDGQYLHLMLNGQLWALRVVEDVNLVSGSAGQEKYGTLVYNSNAATWFTSESDSITVGTIDKQLIQNTVTLLAEGEHTLKTTYPKSFVYLADSIPSEA